MMGETHCVEFISKGLQRGQGDFHTFGRPSMAQELRYRYLLREGDDRVGGLCRADP